MEDFQLLDASDTACREVASTPDNEIDGSSSPFKKISAAEPFAGVGSIGGAKYRLMSPAKLPISRAACITIPPGLSPTSFLESPVLLSNVKVEPSPTTGSLFKAQLMQGFHENVAVSSHKNFSGVDTAGLTISDFEFKFHMGSNTTPGLSSARPAIPLLFNQRGSLYQPHDQQSLQLSKPSSLASNELSSLKDSRVSVHMNVPGSSACGTVNELNQGKQLDTAAIEAPSSDHKDSNSTATVDRTSDDGYGWRKYGQKLVKGSEFPRSYYKCTYPNCEVKKILERAPSGQITDIVYKGSHDHPKPQAARRQNSGTLVSIQEENLEKDVYFTGQEVKVNTCNMKLNISPVLSPLQLNGDGSGSQFQGINDDVDENDILLKRRRMEDGLDVTPVVKPIREPRVVVQTVSEVDILDDGYRWRKYGQKVVRGNPNPRSYYKCTIVGCPVRKHVERASHDPKSVITTYEGKHNHDVPIARNSSHEYAGTTPYPGTSKIIAENTNSISLDLGVGISHVSGDKTNEPVLSLDSEDTIAQNNFGLRLVKSPQIPSCYDILNGSLNLYGNGENHVEGRSIQATAPVHTSSQCPQNLGQIMTGL